MKWNVRRPLCMKTRDVLHAAWSHSEYLSEKNVLKKSCKENCFWANVPELSCNAYISEFVYSPANSDVSNACIYHQHLSFVYSSHDANPWYIVLCEVWKDIKNAFISVFALIHQFHCIKAKVSIQNLRGYDR